MGLPGSKPVQQVVHQATPTPKPNPELDKPWRNFDWGQKEVLKKRLENFRLSNPDVTHVRILIAGQIGAGKSSFINSVNSAFQGKIACEALVDCSESAASHSFTTRLTPYRIRNADVDLPFELCDIMGLEPKTISECQPDDVINTIYGHVREGYKFSKENPLSSDDEHYNETPALSDQAFCLVYVIDANTIQLSDNKIFIEKLNIIRKKISDNNIPQVIVLTKVDEACPLVNKDLKKIYTSKKIKKMMEICKNIVGVPLSNIFPVKNYHEEIDTDDNVDVLILKAFEQIVNFANARLRKGAANV